MSTDAIAGIIGGLVTTLLGAWLAYKYQQKKISDKEIFLNWQNAIRRSAFKGKFNWFTGGTKIERFKENIQDIRVALSQGNTKRQNKDNKGGSISQVSNKKWRVAANKALENLDDIFRIVDNESNFYKEETAKLIDRKRDEIILLFNPIWEKLNLDEFKLPSETGEIEP